MYARITRVQSPPDKLDSLVQSFTSSALPALRELPGYAGSSLAIDRESGDGQAVTFWESEEALASSEQAATGIRGSTVQAGSGEVASVKRLEIVIMERATPASAPSFLRVIRGKADPAKLDAMVQMTRDKALPILRGLDGFRALVVAVDRSAGDVQVTGVWATADARDASDASIADTRRSIFETGGVSAPEISRYEVMSVEFVGVGAAQG